MVTGAADNPNATRRRAAWLVLALGLIVWATLSPQPGPRTRDFSWCLTCEPNWLLDTINNVALFVPLGAAFVYTGMRIGRALLLAAVLSLAIELLQRAGLTTGRTPAFDDVLANSAGAFVGAWLVMRRAAITRAVVQAPATRARLWLVGWTVTVSAMLVGTAWGVAPASRGSAPSVSAGDAVQVSPLDVIPNLDFIQASLTGSVNGVAVSVKSTGQLIAAALPTDTLRVLLLRKVIHEKDRRNTLLGFAYVHAPGGTDEELFVGQFGDDLLMRRAVRASRIGLSTPTLRVRGVFTLDSVLIWKTTRIEAMGAPGILTLRAVGPDPRIGVRAGELELTPALGWALVQPLVEATARVAPLLTLLWMGVWFLPGGIFVYGALRSAPFAVPTRSSKERRDMLTRTMLAALLWTALPFAAAVVGAYWSDVRPLSAWQMTCAVVGVAAGVAVSDVASRRVGRRQNVRAE